MALSSVQPSLKAHIIMKLLSTYSTTQLHSTTQLYKSIPIRNTVTQHMPPSSQALECTQGKYQDVKDQCSEQLKPEIFFCLMESFKGEQMSVWGLGVKT